MTTYKLKRPFTVPTAFTDITVELVTVRRPVAKDFFGIDFSKPVNNNVSMCKLISRCSNITEEQAQNLGIWDYSQITQILIDFCHEKT